MDPRLELRLREIRARVATVDPLLAQLAVAAESGVQIGLVLVLGTHTVQGVPAPSIVTAETLDRDIAHYLRVAAAVYAAQGDEVPELLDHAARVGVDTGISPVVRRADARLNGFLDELAELGISGVDELSDLPQELWERGAAAIVPPRAVTLQDASIREPGGAWEPVGTIRVVLSHVHAWWTYRLGVPEEAAPFLPPEE